MFNKFGFSGDSQLFSSIGSVIDRGFFIFCATLATTFLAIGSAFASAFKHKDKWEAADGFLQCLWLIIWNPYSALILGVILLLIGTIGTFLDQSKQNKRMEGLERGTRKLADTKIALNTIQEELQNSKSSVIKLHGELVETWLKGLSKYLKFDSCARITIYYEHDEEFYLLARYSKNPRYSTIHRQKFPLNQGVISKAWEHGVYKEDKCPISENYEEYAKYLESVYGYQRENIDKLTMNTCRYYAKAILDADIHVGVIVFESTKADFFDQDLDLVMDVDSYCQDHQGQLSKFVRDSLSFDREVSLKREGKAISVEAEFIKLMGELK
ncbi:MAG: hypothetical protein RPR97_10960 [Colwellia sp.]